MQLEFYIITVLMAIIGFLGVYVLNDIKGEIKEMKDSVKGLERDIRESLSSLDRRLTIIETGCRIQHESSNSE